MASMDDLGSSRRPVAVNSSLTAWLNSRDCRSGKLADGARRCPGLAVPTTPFDYRVPRRLTPAPMAASLGIRRHRVEPARLLSLHRWTCAPDRKSLLTRRTDHPPEKVNAPARSDRPVPDVGLAERFSVGVPRDARSDLAPRRKLTEVIRDHGAFGDPRGCGPRGRPWRLPSPALAAPARPIRRARQQATGVPRARRYHRPRRTADREPVAAVCALAAATAGGKPAAAAPEPLERMRRRLTSPYRTQTRQYLKRSWWRSKRSGRRPDSECPPLLPRHDRAKPRRGCLPGHRGRPLAWSGSASRWQPRTQPVAARGRPGGPAGDTTSTDTPRDRIAVPETGSREPAHTAAARQ